MDEKEFERLCAEFFGALKRYVYFRLPSKHDGDDVVQTTLTAAYLGRGSLRSAEGFKPWLLRIAKNKCADFYRRRGDQVHVPLESAEEMRYVQSRYGLTAAETVEDTLESLGGGDERLLRLFYLDGLAQSEIARLLGIPEGTVKSRLHAAKKRFRSAYPYPPKTTKGEGIMSKLPEVLPEYTIERLDKPIFPVKWEENMGWFIIPRLGEKISWAMYDYPGRVRSEVFDIEVTGRARVHGIEGVEIISKERNTVDSGHKNNDCTRTFVAQLTDTHCRLLAESHIEDGVKLFHTFLDGDEFIHNWGFGEDNCGKEVNVRQKGIIRKDGSKIETDDVPFLLDAVGRYAVTVGGRTYDTVCIVDVEYYNSGVMAEQYIDQNGRTVLWRRFNRDDWKLKRYGKLWSERLPGNERVTVNGEVFVHWYDCVTDYIF